MKIDVKTILCQNFNENTLKIYDCRKIYEKFTVLFDILESKIPDSFLEDFYIMNESFEVFYDMYEIEFDNFLFNYLKTLF